MRAEEFDHGTQYCRIIQPPAQRVRGQPGKREKAFRPVRLTEDPAKRR